MPKLLTADERADRAMAETELVKQVIAELKEYGFRVAHWPDSRRLVGDKGVPDILACRPPHVLWIECKRQVGGKHYPGQREWQLCLHASGQRVLIVKPVDVRMGRLAAYLDGLPRE